MTYRPIAVSEGGSCDSTHVTAMALLACDESSKWGLAYQPMVFRQPPADPLAADHSPSSVMRCASSMFGSGMGAHVSNGSPSPRPALYAYARRVNGDAKSGLKPHGMSTRDVGSEILSWRTTSLLFLNLIFRHTLSSVSFCTLWLPFCFKMYAPMLTSGSSRPGIDSDINSEHAPATSRLNCWLSRHVGKFTQPPLPTSQCPCTDDSSHPIGHVAMRTASSGTPASFV
mmetsp:Transcript_52404/g.131728  ORF Transcript_52404/g.131728 Transcript_52404/m.131728 type:complete len:228 (+) Transcript_52404:240-923(+)